MGPIYHAAFHVKRTVLVPICSGARTDQLRQASHVRRTIAGLKRSRAATERIRHVSRETDHRRNRSRPPSQLCQLWSDLVGLMSVVGCGRSSSVSSALVGLVNCRRFRSHPRAPILNANTMAHRSTSQRAATNVRQRLSAPLMSEEQEMSVEHACRCVHVRRRPVRGRTTPLSDPETRPTVHRSRGAAKSVRHPS